MGMFDYVQAIHPDFVCSEGHALHDEEFQTKDFACVLGTIGIGDTVFVAHQGSLGSPLADERDPIEGQYEMGCACVRCPAFVQGITYNLCACEVTFRVTVVAGKVMSVERISQSTAEFIANEPQLPYMADCRGPMSYEDARKRHIDGKFFPWDPVPVVGDEAKAAQQKWADEVNARRAKWKAARAAREEK